jgi:hypothetical protein
MVPDAQARRTTAENGIDPQGYAVFRFSKQPLYSAEVFISGSAQ